MKQTRLMRPGSAGLTAKKLLLIVFFIMSHIVQAQVTIGTEEEPDEEALLDLKENSNGTSTRGLLLPRVYLSGLDLPDPLTEHRQGMLVYNLTEDSQASLTEGIYFNNGYKWKNISVSTGEEGYKLKEAVTLNEYSGAAILAGQGSNTYNRYDLITAYQWHTVFESNLNISGESNRLSINAQIPIQCVVPNGTATADDWASYAIGLFIDGKLEAVRVSTNILEINDPDYNTLQETVSFTVDNLSTGTKSIKLCFLKRADRTGTTSNNSVTIYVASRYPDSSNNVNDFMLKPTMSYWLYEK